MPTGVPIAVPAPTMKRLPRIAFKRPPSLPGGGVILVNSASDSPPTPACSSVHRIQPSQNRPNSMASMDTVMLKRCTKRRLA